MTRGIPLRFRVFLSSPGDVADECALALRLFGALMKEYAFEGKVLIQDVARDDPDRPVALSAHLTPQEAINRERGNPSDCDLVVVILWSRLGTLLPPSISKPDGSPYRSGTEWEFLDALEGAERNDGKPLVWVYRRTEKVTYDDDDPLLDQKRAKRQAVKDFFAEFIGEGGSLKRSYPPMPRRANAPGCSKGSYANFCRNGSTPGCLRLWNRLRSGLRRPVPSRRRNPSGKATLTSD